MSDVADDRLARAIAGDHEALTELLAEAGRSVRAQIAADLPQRWQSLLALDDVMQQTFTDAFLAIQRYQPRGADSFRAWLLTLARRNLQDCIRLLEAEKRGGSDATPAATGSSLDRLLDRLTGSITSPSRHAVREEGYQALRTALQDLPALHRQVIEALDLEGRSADALATELGRTRGAIYMIRARAHRWLAELLGGATQFGPDFE